MTDREAETILPPAPEPEKRDTMRPHETALETGRWTAIFNGNWELAPESTRETQPTIPDGRHQ